MSRTPRFVPGLAKAVVENVRIEEDCIVVTVRPCKRERFRCPVCGARRALLEGRENATDGQRKKLAELENSGSRLFRAWVLKEDLRAVFQAEDAARAGGAPRRLAAPRLPLPQHLRWSRWTGRSEGGAKTS